MFALAFCRLKPGVFLANDDRFEYPNSSSSPPLISQFLSFLAPLVKFASAAAASPKPRDVFMAEPIRSEFSSLWDSHRGSVRSDDDVRKEDMKTRMELYILSLQKKLCDKLQEFEPDERFVIDRWKRDEGGGGITCVIQQGSVLEKAGVNISVVWGDMPPAMAEHMRSRGKQLPTSNSQLPPHAGTKDSSIKFFAAGISSVIHPRNPYVPTMHFNYRYFEIENPDTKERSAWFGGGSDLTPYYLDAADVKHFHEALKSACDKHDPSYYSRFKKWCDEYFVIKYRGETRGVGGIFFDELELPSLEKAFSFVKDCGAAVIPSYIPLVERNKDRGYGLRERDWQLLRRGRYVEFNLVYDRGTKFGLFTPGARHESILMSLPATAKWSYNYEPQGPEADLVAVLKKPRDWA